MPAAVSTAKRKVFLLSLSAAQAHNHWQLHELLDDYSVQMQTKY